MSKTLYLVRHGETDANQAHRFSAPADQLSELGRKQSGMVAERLRAYPIQRIVTSSFSRAVETATIINEALKIPLVQDDRLVEVSFPSDVTGKPRTPETLSIMAKIREEVRPFDWQYADSESWGEVYARASAFLQDQLAAPEEHILVVSHGALLQAMVRWMMFGEALTPAISHQVELFYASANAGLSIVDYVNDRWRLRVWNEHSYLN